MKAIICLYGTRCIGKTSAITWAYQKLANTYAIPHETIKGDFCAVLDFPCGKIGFVSMGDPGSSQKDCLDDLVQKDCNIIVCASRTKGETLCNVYDLQRMGYSLIMTSPFSCKDVDSVLLNDSFADGLISLVHKILLK